MCLNFISAVFYFQIFRLKCVHLSSDIRATCNMSLPFAIGFVALAVFGEAPYFFSVPRCKVGPT